MIRVLIVDDSPVARELLTHILDADPALTVVGAARDGLDGLQKTAQLRPDVVVMDINMPRMDGFAATEAIMASSAVPIVIVSAAWDPDSVETTFRAMEAGALAILRKPAGPDHPDYLRQANQLTQTVRTMSEVKVITRYRHAAQQPGVKAQAPLIRPALPMLAPVEVVAIGASTGGPLVLQTILSALPSDFPIPILVVQHIADGFLAGMLDWLGQTSTLPLHIAANRQVAQAGHVYFAPNDFHLGIDRRRKLSLTPGEPLAHLCPSVSHMFASALTAFGPQVIGVLLTGMGKDGARELKDMHTAGAFTIAQDALTSVVNGMPGEAAALHAARLVLPDIAIASHLIHLTKHVDRPTPKQDIPSNE